MAWGAQLRYITRMCLGGPPVQATLYMSALLVPRMWPVRTGCLAVSLASMRRDTKPCLQQQLLEDVQRAAPTDRALAGPEEDLPQDIKDLILEGSRFLGLRKCWSSSSRPRAVVWQAR